MTPRSDATLILNDGGLGGLTACWAEGVCRSGGAVGKDEAPPPVAWFAGQQLSGPDRRLAVVRRQIELCCLSDLIEPAATSMPAGAQRAESALRRDGLALTQMLLAAAADAIERHIERVIWPIHSGAAGRASSGGTGGSGGGGADPDLDTIADACDRALLVSQVANLDAPGGAGVRIETPYVDFTDAQLFELALDLDAPLDAFWSCLHDADRPCGSCPECRRWKAAMDAACQQSLPPMPEIQVRVGKPKRIGG